MQFKIHGSHLIFCDTKKQVETSVGSYNEVTEQFSFNEELKKSKYLMKILNHPDLRKNINQIETANVKNVAPENILFCKSCNGLVVETTDKHEFKWKCTNCGRLHYNMELVEKEDLKTVEGAQSRINFRKFILDNLMFMEEFGITTKFSNERKSELMRIVERNGEHITTLKIIQILFDVLKQHGLRQEEILVNGEFILNDRLYEFLDQFVEKTVLGIIKDESTGVISVADELAEEVLFTVAPLANFFDTEE